MRHCGFPGSSKDVSMSRPRLRIVALAASAPALLAAATMAVIFTCQSRAEPEPPPANEWARTGWEGTSPGGVVAIVFSPDGSKLATAHHDVWPSSMRVSLCREPRGTLQLWERNALMWERNQLLQFDAIGSICRPDFIWPTMHFDASGTHLQCSNRQGILRWNVADGLQTEAIDGLDAISPDGRLITIQTEGELQIVDRCCQTAIATPSIEGYVWSSRFSPDGRHLAFTEHTLDLDQKTQFILWDLNQGAVHWRKLQGWWADFQFSPKGDLLATVCKSHVRVWEVATGSLWKDFQIETEAIWDLAWSPDSQLLAVCFERESQQATAVVKVWNAQSGALVTTIYEDGNLGRDDWGVTAVAFSPDGKTLAAGYPNGDVRFWTVPR
jgi:WD40 repeat protein